VFSVGGRFVRVVSWLKKEKMNSEHSLQAQLSGYPTICRRIELLKFFFHVLSCISRKGHCIFLQRPCTRSFSKNTCVALECDYISIYVSYPAAVRSLECPGTGSCMAGLVIDSIIPALLCMQVSRHSYMYHERIVKQTPLITALNL
jgi:hypothetical protein